MEKKKGFYLEEEMIIVRQSGEIPEVALHGSLHFLSEDPEGPGLELDAEDRMLLAGQALRRYREIILRDLDPENRDKSLYRGVARCIVNWERCRRFCEQEYLDTASIRQEVAAAFIDFLGREIAEVRAGRRSSCLNCSAEKVSSFAEDLGVSPAALPENWQEYCLR